MGHSLPGTQLVETIASGEPYPVKALWLTTMALRHKARCTSGFFPKLSQSSSCSCDRQIMTPTRSNHP